MKREVLGFDGSMNEVASSASLKNDVLNDIVNYEHKDLGKITKRVDEAVYSAGLNAIMISDTIVFSGGTILYQPEEPFYPPRMPETSSGDVLYPVFGKTSGGNYKLILFYLLDASTWTYEVIDITGVTYNDDSVLRIAYDRDRMLIADGQNKSHFVTINQDNEFVYAINEIPRPLNKPNGVDTVTYNISLFQENLDTGAYINYCGIYRYWYTFVTEDGDESNPSPASDWIDMQFFKKDDDDLDEREVKSVTISNLEITSNANSVKEQIKYFRIYREELQYTNGIETRVPLFIKEIIVSDKDGSNQFTDTIAILSGDTTVNIDYENDSSPKGNDICSVSGTTVLGGIKKKLEFPFDFDHYREVTLTNPNSRSYVDGVVRVKFDDDTNFGILSETPDWSWLMDNKDKVRFFDNDLTTPLATVYSVSGGIDWSGHTDNIVNGGFDADTDWTKNGWIISDGIASNASSNREMITQTVAPLTQDLYYINRMDFTLDGDSDEDGLMIEDYKLQVKDGTGDRSEAFIIKASTTAYGIEKTAGSSIKSVDDVAAYGIGAGGVVQNLTNPEMSSNTGWTPDVSLDWVYNSGTFRNLVYTSRGDLAGDRDVALVDGTKYLVTMKVFLKNPNPSQEMAKVFLGDTEDNSFGISGQGWRYISRIVEAGGDKFSIGKRADGEITVYYARVTEITYGTNDITAYIKVPEIPISDSKTIYQVWCEQGGSVGVNSCDWTVPKYGQFVDYSDSAQWATQKTFGNVGVETVDTKICSPCQITELTDEVYNRADVNTNGDLNNATFNADDICLLPALGVDLTTSENTVQIDTITANSGAEYNFDPKFKLPLSGVYFAGFVSIDGTNFNGDNSIIDLEFENSGTKHMFLWPDNSGVWNTRCHESTETYNIITNAVTNAVNEYFICLSWSDDDKISLFVYNLTQDDYSFEEKTGSTNYARYTGFNIFQLGGNLTGVESILDTQYANWIFDTGQYLSAGTVTHQNAVQNLANRMPLMDIDVIGYNWNTPAENQNVDIGDIEDLDYEDYSDWIGFSKVNGVSFPDKYVKKCAGKVLRVIPVPSYLRGQTKYENSIVVFYRNGFNVFPLKGDPSTWNDSAENLIPERKRDGLVNKDTLVVTPYGLMWQSEAGLMLWNSSEYRNVSLGRMDLPIKSTLKGLYLPLTQQYMLHDNAYNSESVEVTFVAMSKSIVLSTGTWDTDTYKVGTKIFISSAVDATNNKGFTIATILAGTITVAETVVGVLSDTVTIKKTKSYVYDIPEDKFTTFEGLDVLYASALSGGSTTQNLNLFLDSYNAIQKYPDYDESKTSTLSYATKVFDTFYSDYDSIEPVISGSATYDLLSTDTQNSNTETTSDNTLLNYKVNNIPYGYFGEKIQIKLKNADTIENVIIAYRPRNTRR